MTEQIMDFSDIADEVAALQADANVAKAGGGGYVPPPEGPARLRFVGYMELGVHFKKGNPARKIADKDQPAAWLIFELSGPKHEPKVLEDGTKIPHRITVKLNHSLNEKAGYYRLFKRMNDGGDAKSFIQLLGRPYLADVKHFKPPVEAGKEPIVIANFLDDEKNLTIRPPRVNVMDPETQEISAVTLRVDPPISQQRCFVWNADAKFLGRMWTSIAIPEDTSLGDDGKPKPSRNVYQNMVKAALNFEGSPIQQYLKSAGMDLGVPPAEKDVPTGTPAAVDSDDPLNGVGN